MKKGVLENFAKFTGKQLCQSLFFNEAAGLKHLYQSLFLIKLQTLAQVFSCKFYKIFKNIFFTEHLWWLLLYFIRNLFSKC